MGSAFFFGSTCPADATGLASDTSKALQSPMTVAIRNAGWEGGVHLINTFIFVTCLSAVNSSIYIGSRTLSFMAQDGKAPAVFARTNIREVPVPAVVFTNLCGALSMMNISTGAGKAYGYIVNISGVSTFLVWASISYTHIIFRQAWKHQGLESEELPFKSFAYPWNAYFGLVANILLALVQGWTTLSPFDAANFVDAYILLLLFPLIYLAYRFTNKTQLWRLDEIELQAGRCHDLDEPEPFDCDEPSAKPRSTWHRLWKSI
jgi:yeast amino acid transporter